MRLSSRVASVSASVTLAISARAKALKARGEDIIDFGVGEPDFDTPDFIKQVANEAIADGFTKYTPVAGTAGLRAAITTKLRRDNGLDYAPQEILVSNGAKQALFNTLACVVQDGDEVIIPSPYWVSYPEMVKLCSGKPVYIETSEEAGFKLSASALTEALTPRTRALVLNSPCNPTGSVYTREELAAIGKVLTGTEVLVICDEIYEKLIYDGVKHHSLVAVCPQLKPISVVVNGVSKSCAMTGWRIGYAAGPAELIAAMTKFQSHTTSGACSISQAAAEAALSGPQDEVEKMRALYQQRRDAMAAGLSALTDLRFTLPKGAFYMFPNISKLKGRTIVGREVIGSLALAELLLDCARIAAVPGVAFGSDDHLRLSFATDIENIRKGMERLKELLG